MKRTGGALWPAGLLLGSLLLGCLGFGNRTVRHYLLLPLPPSLPIEQTGTLPDRATPVAKNGQVLVLGLGPIGLPDYLDRPEIVSRTGESQLQLSDEERWAEPLRQGVTRVMTENLGRLLGTGRVLPFPGTTGPTERLDCQVRLWIDRFEVNDGGQGELVARWEVDDGQGKLLLRWESHLTREPTGQDTAGRVGALSQLLADLSREIAKAIGRVL